MKKNKHIPFAYKWFKLCPISLSTSIILILFCSGCIVKEGLPTNDDDPNSPLPPAVDCLLDDEPVCGINGVTYNNRCEAGDTAISYTGSCGVAWSESRESCIDLGLLGEQSYLYIFLYYPTPAELSDNELYTRVEISMGLVPFSHGEGWDELLNLVELQSVEATFQLEDGSKYPVFKSLEPSVTFEPTKITYSQSEQISDDIRADLEVVALINMRNQDCELRAMLINEAMDR